LPHRRVDCCVFPCRGGSGSGRPLPVLLLGATVLPAGSPLELPRPIPTTNSSSTRARASSPPYAINAEVSSIGDAEMIGPTAARDFVYAPTSARSAGIMASSRRRLEDIQSRAVLSRDSWRRSSLSSAVDCPFDEGGYRRRVNVPAGRWLVEARRRDVDVARRAGDDNRSSIMRLREADPKHHATLMFSRSHL
jgi:hypothetical protein